MTTSQNQPGAGTGEPSASPIDTLLMLGAAAPKSPEEGKPTIAVDLTAVEIKALAMLSGQRLRDLFWIDDGNAQRMAAIYLGLTSKLTLAGLRAALTTEVRP